jgi:ABC-type phosphate transport system substrate-binding protein
MTTTMTRGWRAAVAAVCVFALLGAGVAAQKTMQITGAGATFPDPIYEKWCRYNKPHPGHPDQLPASDGRASVDTATVFSGQDGR